MTPPWFTPRTRGGSTMTTISAPPDDRTAIHIKDAAQLIAAVPHLLGFRPACSVVVLGFGGSSGRRIDQLVRVDLPAPAGESDLAELLATVFARHSGRAVAILVVAPDPGPPPDPPPHRRLVTCLVEAFEALEKQVEHTLW